MGEAGRHRAEAGVRVVAWVRGWPRRPREPLGWRDLIPNTGRFMLWPVLAAGLMYGGGWTLFGPHQTFRLGGLLALLGGILLAALIVLYVRRPTTASSRTSPAAGTVEQTER